MFSKSRFTFFLTVILMVVIVGCSKYEKLLKSDDYILKYDKAIEFYTKGDWVRSATLIEQILPVYRGTDKAEILNFYLANSYYQRKDYITSAHLFNTFIRDYPASQYSEDVYFLRALSNYRLSPRPSLDQSYTLIAIDQFKLFNTRFPASPRTQKARQYIEELTGKLVEKSYRSALLYYDMGDYKAAITAFKTSLNEFPDSRYREEIMFSILRASYLLAENSIPEKRIERYEDAVDEYYIFIDEFPQSKYISQAERFYQGSIRYIRTGSGDELTLER